LLGGGALAAMPAAAISTAQRIPVPALPIDVLSI